MKNSLRQEELEQLFRAVEAWERVVTEVEEGYILYLDDYTNDIFTRTVIHMLLSKLASNTPAAEIEELLRRLEQADNRFKNTTSVVKKPLIRPPSDVDSEIAFWCFRVPVNMGEDLKDDLLREGFLQSNDTI